ncbi:hypothetical protein cand_002520 [Cryptosporidium andersoni]|uniref:RecA family profile 1 domain-containing protein n=1 Tax=Cryptosporidium andersoni TaxID=117008 RepID=A0A1J4MNV4_9CRYT|nr:hypothetical protein cand_002520 [Cryptosporidium andersoni]
MDQDPVKTLQFPPYWWRSRSFDEIIEDSRYIKHLSQYRLSTGSYNIDNILNGGIPKGCLFEITGEAGSGKTQWCLNLAISVLIEQIKSMSGNFIRLSGIKNIQIGIVCILFTEDGTFPSDRLYEITLNKLRNIRSMEDEYEVDDKELDTIAHHLLNKVCIFHLKSISISDFIQKNIPALFSKFKIEALIIDSITNIFISNLTSLHNCTKNIFSNNIHKAINTTTSLLQFANTLKRIAIDHECWLIITNRTTTDISMNSLYNNNENIKPSLGLLWSNSVNWRIFISKDKSTVSLNTNNQLPRIINIQLSPETPKLKMNFHISSHGIVD